MEARPSILKRLPYPILTAGIGLSIGLMIPAIYKLGSGSRIYGREQQLLWATWLTLALTGVASVSWIVWKKYRSAQPSQSLIEQQQAEPAEPILNFQFSIRGLLIATASLAFLFATAPLFSKSLQGIVVLVMLAAILSWAIFFRRSTLSHVSCWLAGMYFPFAWLFPFSKPFGGHVSGLIESFLTSPGLIPGMFVGRLYDSHPSDGPALFIVVVTTLLAGTLLIRRGGKLAVAFIICSTILSVLTSMFLHVMYRA